MARSKPLLGVSALLGAAVLVVGVSTVASQDVTKPPAPKPRPRLDITKTLKIERPVTNVVKGSAPAVTPVPPKAAVGPRLDVGKTVVIERPVANVVKGSAPAPAAPVVGI